MTAMFSLSCDTLRASIASVQLKGFALLVSIIAWSPLTEAAPTTNISVGCTTTNVGKAVINEVNTNADFIEIYLLQSSNISNWTLWADDTKIATLGAGTCKANGTTTADNSPSTTWPAGTFISCSYNMNPSNNEVLLADSTTTSRSTATKVIDYLSYGTPSPSAVWTVAPGCGTLYPAHAPGNQDIARVPDGSGTLADNGDNVSNGTSNATAVLHHVELQHGSGTGVTCTSSTLTLRACADTANPCTLYTGGVTGTLSATGAPAVNWSGGTGFTIGSGGTVTKDVQVATPGSVVFGTSSTVPAGNATTCNFGSPACTFTAADAMFIFDYSGSPVHAATTSVLPNFVAETAQTVTLRAVRKSDGATNTCVPAFSGTTNVNFSCCYSNPTTGSTSVRVNGDANTLSCSTNAACPADTAAAAGTRSIPVTFDASGVASGVTLNYADVGQVKLRADAVASGMTASLSMVGSATFIAAPASFAVTTVRNGGATAYVAGTPFTTTVTARNSADSTTPNFGRETTAESVKLLPVTTAAASASNSQLVGPTGASVATGLLTIGSFSFMAGSASDSQSAWSEVGDIILSAALKSGSYLGSGLSAWGKTSANVGPFRPHHFTTGATEGCAAGSFTYAGQPFKVLVTAMSQDNALLGTTNAVTQNYFGSYAKKTTLSADGASACGDTTNFGANILADATVSRTNSFGYTYATAGNDYQSGVGAWRDGANLPLPYLTYTAAAPIAPTTLTLCAKDDDGVTSHSYTQGQVHIRSGRLRIANAFGSEQLALRMAAQTEYYNGSAWATNTDDNCTTFATLNGPTSFTPALGTATPRCLITANTCTSTDGVACNDSAASSKVANGSVGLCVTKPGTAGYVDVTFATPPYLQFSGVNPSARASFGLYSNPVKIIDRREVR